MYQPTPKLFCQHLLPCLALSLSMLFAAKAFAHGETPPSLKGVSIIPTPGLLDGPNPIVTDQTAVIELGKALFWDIQVGSDGTACASCHFHAGADARFRNQLSPGMLHTGASTRRTFEATASGAIGGANYTLKQSDFPLYRLADPTDRDSAVLFQTDDVVSSSGTFLARYRHSNAPRGMDRCTPLNNNIFHSRGLNTRQVETRQAPSVINASFNFRNFWDGSANNIFNGVSQFGLRDQDARIWVLQSNGSVSLEAIALENASMASQAVAAVLDTREMSCRNRQFPDVGRKLLPRAPLAFQRIHADDSVLGPLRHDSGRGLDTTYESLIKKSFAPRFWSAAGDLALPGDSGDTRYTQMEANFSLFFGLALQLYQDTLVSDETPFDRPRLPGPMPQRPRGFNDQQQRGLEVFMDTHCFLCHGGPTLSNAAHPKILFPTSTLSPRLVNRRTLNGAFSGSGVIFGLFDEGFFNTSVSPTSHDRGLGGTDPFGNPLSLSRQYLNRLGDGKPMPDPVTVNSCQMDNSFSQSFLVSELIDDPYITGSCGSRVHAAKIPRPSVLQAELQKFEQGRLMTAVDGAFKSPSLRNVELTGPYMHDGSLLTLEQVVDFYARGGNFNNPQHFATTVFPQDISDSDKAALVVFLKSLTDERVRWERAPFDHPELRIPHGHNTRATNANSRLARDRFMTIPAVGKDGRDPTLGPLMPFHTLLEP